MPEVDLQEFTGLAVWWLRMELGKTQGQLASMVGVVEATLNRYENAFQLPKDSILKKLENIARQHELADLVFAFDYAYRMRLVGRRRKIQLRMDSVLAMINDVKKRSV